MKRQVRIVELPATSEVIGTLALVTVNDLFAPEVWTTKSYRRNDMAMRRWRVRQLEIKAEEAGLWLLN